MLQLCGKPGHSLVTSLWSETVAIHMAPGSSQTVVHKLAKKPLFIPLLLSFLYTVYEQFYNITISVIPRLVHSMHRAYIYENNSKKGFN